MDPGSMDAAVFSRWMALLPFTMVFLVARSDEMVELRRPFALVFFVLAVLLCALGHI